jgi:hypothetical protein
VIALQQRIACFEFIRDIPFHIGLNGRDPSYNCVTKCDMLATMLSSLDLKSRQILCTFDWTETSLPPDILALPRDPGETHLFLQVYIPEIREWVNCDPPWNKQLKKAKFPIAKWDGLGHTTLAVKPHIIYSPKDTVRLMDDENDPNFAAKHMRKHRLFYKAINAWLDQFK